MIGILPDVGHLLWLSPLWQTLLYKPCCGKRAVANPAVEILLCKPAVANPAVATMLWQACCSKLCCADLVVASVL